MNMIKNIAIVLVSLVLIGIPFHFVNAQQPKTNTNAKPAAAGKNIKKMEAEIDSLNGVITEYKTAYANAVAHYKQSDSIINSLDEKLSKLEHSNNDLQKKLSNFKGENLKLDQSNRILIIFNSIVGILLFSSLIWFLRNMGKKKAASQTSIHSSNGLASANESPVAVANPQYFDSKLEQLEKLGKLRERGILNEEEFNRQKQQVLNSNS
jgi:septal ring factor EnvC (AmiA/AmiB activator)